MSSIVAGGFAHKKEEKGTNMNTVTETSHKGGNAQTLKYAEDEIKHIPLTDIHTDWDWNARSRANVQAPEERTEDREAPGIVGLQISLRQVGQDEPVVVRRVSAGTSLGGSKTDKPWELVAGFRRYDAITAMNTSEAYRKEADEKKESIVKNTPNGTIRAVVRDLDAKHARSLNVRENTARNSMSTPDLCWAVREMVLQKLDAKEIAQQLDISVSYATVLVRVAKLCHKSILLHWRNGGEFDGIASGVRVKLNDLDELCKRADEHAKVGREFDMQKEYKKLLQGTASKAKKDKQWIEAGKKKATAYGEMLGLLQYFGFLKLTGKISAFDTIMGTEEIPTNTLAVTGKKKLTQKQAQKFADAFEEAFDAMKDGPPEPEEAEADEEEEDE